MTTSARKLSHDKTKGTRPTTKGALLPAVRVDADVRADAERVIGQTETLSSFIEQAVISETARRLARQAFLDRGIQSAQEARETGVYYTSDFVLSELEEIVATAEKREAKR